MEVELGNNGGKTALPLFKGPFCLGCLPLGEGNQGMAKEQNVYMDKVF